MYYRITDSLLTIAEGSIPGQSSEKAREVLSYLDLAVRLGKHFVFADVLCFQRVFKINSKLVNLRSIYSSYSEYGAIASNLSWHVEFVGTDKESMKDIDRKVIYLRIDLIPSFEVFAETRFLCENLIDIKFYDYLLKWYKQSNRMSINCCYYPLLGGGGTTADVYSFEIDRRKNFVLCITDSDYKFKNTVCSKSLLGNSALGDTAKKVIEVERKKDCFFSIFYYLSRIAELENLVPLSLYKKVSEALPDLTQRYNIIETLYKIDKDYLCFLDMKNGVSLWRLSTAHESDNIIQIVSSIKPLNNTIIETETNRIINELKKEGINEGDEFFEEKKKHKMKKIKYIEGFGQKIMDNIINLIPESDIDSLFSSATDTQKIEMNTIGELLLNWSCATFITRV